MGVLSKAMAVLSRPASFNSSFSNSGRFIKARPVAAMAGLSPRSGRVARSLDLVVSYKQFINGQVEPFLERAGKAIGQLLKLLKLLTKLLMQLHIF